MTTLVGLLAFGPFGPQTAFSQAGGLDTPPPVGPAKPFKLPTVHERTLPNGLRVLFLEEHEQPVVSMNLLIKSGAAVEPAERAGLAQMTAALVDTGTETRTAKQVAETIDSAGGSLDVSAEWDATTASTTVLANHAETAAGLLADVVTNPVFKPEEIDRVRKQTLSALQLNLSNPAFVAEQVFNKAVFGASPYAHPIGGTPATIGALTREDIVAFHKATYVPNNAILAVVGDLTPEAAFALAERHFSKWEKGGPVADVKPTPPQTGKARIVVLDKPDAVQTEIRAGLTGINRTDPDYFSAVVANTIFGGPGFSSRIGQELRVKRGLTYGAYSRFDARRMGGAFQVSTNTKTESTAEAVQIILEQMNRIRGEDVPADELKTRKDFLTGSYVLSLETPDAIASRLLSAELYGLGRSYLETYTSRIEGVTAADVRRVVQARMRPDQLVIVLAGNAAGFEEQIRKLELGTVEKIPFDEVDTLSDTLRRERAAPAAVSAADAKSGAALAEQTIAALGGDRFVNQKSLVLRGKGTISPAPGQSFPLQEITEHRVFPNKVRIDLNAGVMVIRTGYDGTTGWADQPGAGIVDATAQFKQNEREGVVALRAFRAGGWTARPMPDAEVNGKAAKVFALADAEGNETTFYVDAATHLPIKVSFEAGQAKREVVFSDYREVSGVQVPFSVEQWVQGSQFLVATYTDAQVDAQVDPSLFAKPAN
jgi:zinc protease